MTDLDGVMVVGLATWQAVEVWHHGDLFAGGRAAVENWQGGVRGRLADLLGCPFCTSVWAGLALSALWACPPWWARLPVWALAASRLANAGNDLTHAACRTPGRGVTIPVLSGEEHDRRSDDAGHRPGAAGGT